uniref:Calpain catalytic domain-containing protein n=1 Tax=Ciona savignyi TaxID=51511 RepID=H2ZIF1_CIOSA
MGNNSSSSSTEPDGEPDVTEVVVEAPLPVEPRVDPDVRENIEGTSLNSNTITSEFNEIKEVILNRSLEAGKAYVYRDKDFPAEPKSLYYTSRAPNQWKDIAWKRPTDLSKNPRLLQDGQSSEDIVQGMLGNCWFLASCAAIARSAKHIQKVVPGDQVISGPDYVGMFHFRFWRFGKWVDVIVDDQLPSVRGSLCFGRSANRDEFWLPLLEKAYAKVHGSYQAIEGGFTQDGMEDLTGGIAVTYQLGGKTPDHLYRTMTKALRNDSFVCGGIQGTSESVDKKTGLVSAHAYSALKVAKVNYRGSTVKLVKLRNPWGGKNEWKGDWSDDSYTWQYIPDDVKYSIGYANRDNGEWFMSFDDFTRYFTDVTFCTIGPDFDGDGKPTGDRWLLSTAQGKWQNGVNSGGSRNDLRKYQTNPQYFLEFFQPDVFHPGEDLPEEEGKCSVVLGLMQEYRRQGRADGMKNLYLCLNVFRVSSKPSGKLDYRFFSRNREVVTTGSYINRREVNVTAELDPGKYVIVTFHLLRRRRRRFLDPHFYRNGSEPRRVAIETLNITGIRGKKQC